jgi:hypothetical protein
MREIAAAAVVFVALAAVPALARADDDVQIVPNEAARRVDVFIGGKPFTSYFFTENLKKPVLYPLRTASGALVTRGFPLEPRQGEPDDHPHQFGLWFNYGDVNGVDFWNNSTARTPEEQARMGVIVHRSVDRAAGGKGKGELEVSAEWVMPGGSVVMRERTRFVFRALASGARAIDRVTTLTAVPRVVLKDNKEGLFGMRVAHTLQQPSAESPDGTGLYRSSEGKTGDDVWGSRGRWVTLAGKVGSEQVTLAMFDHPKNPGYPTYWHARGYGLFAANPLGQRVFQEAKKEPTPRELNLTLEPGQSATFRYRLVIASSGLDPEALYRTFAGTK